MSGSSGEKAAWLAQFRERAAAARQALRHVEMAWSWGRLLSFLAAGVVMYAWWNDAARVLVTAGFLLVVFALSVRSHRRALLRRRQADHLLQIIDETAARLGGRRVTLRSSERPADPDVAGARLAPPFDDGPVFELTDQERGDLDLFASPIGLFALLNRTSSSCGLRRLRDMLERPSLADEAIRGRQQAVRWLDEHRQERMSLMAGTVDLRLRHRETDRLIAALHTRKPFVAPAPLACLRVWGAASLVATVWAFVEGGLGRYTLATPWLSLMALNWFLLFRLRHTLRATLAPWGGLLPAVQGCRQAIGAAAVTLPHDTRLGVVREHFVAVNGPPVLRRLERRLAWTDSGGIIHALLNLVLLWDLHLAASIVRVVGPNRDGLLRALAALAELDALSSLGAFAWEQPTACYPQLAAAGGLHIESGVHPLLDPSGAVPNDVTLTESLRTWIVTGSNMAGKSTFLRMIGVNVLLAQAGTVAMARAMTWRPVRIVTDLRTTDSLVGNESYFLAEIRHIRRMVLPPSDGAACLGLIDEPFRGTNSDEQVAASLALGEHLIAAPHFFLIATHDQRLTELADDVHACNVHFREHLGGDGLVFDYRLRPGPAQTRNALLLLERAGFPDSLIKRARERLSEGT